MDRNQRSAGKNPQTALTPNSPAAVWRSRLGLEKGNARAPKRCLKRPRLPPPCASAAARPAQEINPRRQATAPARYARTRHTGGDHTGKAPPLSAGGTACWPCPWGVVSINLLSGCHDLPGRELRRLPARRYRHLHVRRADRGAGHREKLQPVRLPPRKDPAAGASSSRIWSMSLWRSNCPPRGHHQGRACHGAVRLYVPRRVDGLERLSQGLRTDVSQRDGLILLTMSLPTDFSPWWGRTSSPRAITRSLARPSRPQRRQRPAGQRTANADRNVDGLQENNLFDAGTTALNIQDLSDIEFTYKNRVQVLLVRRTSPTSCGLAAR